MRSVNPRTGALPVVALAALLLVAWGCGGRPGARSSEAKYVILLIGDGMGAKHVEAFEHYTQGPAPHASWRRSWMATYAARGSYDPQLAWADFDYVGEGATDSAAAATAMYTGAKTAVGRISVSADTPPRRLTIITEKARALGMGVGSVTTVELSDATPGAWMAHNDRRSNGFAIADEGLWGEPSATGTTQDSPYYGGSHGPSQPPLDVVMGAAHPHWHGGHFVNDAIRNRLAGESGQPCAFEFLERQPGQMEAGSRLLEAAANPTVRRLAGLYGGVQGRLEPAFADGSGRNPENPTLAEMTRAALEVLGRNPAGFLLMVEGGAIDLASHNNNMDDMLGEAREFMDAVRAVSDWVDDSTNGSSWDNTLVLVTADHETGYLTAGPDVLPDRPLGTLDARTIRLEKTMTGTGLRASWEDVDGNGRVDPGEIVYWCWNSTNHSNSLVPISAKGVGSELLKEFSTGQDPVRGPYLQNTDVFRIISRVIEPRPGSRPRAGSAVR